MASLLPLAIDRAGALTAVKRWLEGTFDATQSPGVPRGVTDAWRFQADIEGQRLELEVQIPDAYPRSLPRIALVDPPAFGTWPHVELDGHICLASPAERYDRGRAIDVVRTLIEGAFDVLAQGIAGTNEDDFRTEFRSYWDAVEGRGTISLLDPCGPSRVITVWQGKHSEIIADSPHVLRHWLRNSGKKHVADVMIKSGVLVWLPRLPVPREYPTTIDELYALAAGAEGDAVELIKLALVTATSNQVTVVLGAESGNGVSFGALKVKPRQVVHARPPRCPKRRRGAAPALAARQWNLAKLIRARVLRADAFWVHGRDANPDLAHLGLARVAMIGCGSLGSHTARLLALAGVAELRLIDPEVLEWANIGRHVLGASVTGQNKARALAEQLSREFPLHTFTGFTTRWQENAEALRHCDLVVSTTGSLDDEAELTIWQRDHPGQRLLFGWTEPQGCASQAVAVMPGAGCLLCGFTGGGDPSFKITEWPELPLRQEPACGNWFMPYGANEITAAAVLTSTLALDVLTGRAAAGAHRLASARPEMLAAAGGTWSKGWLAASEERPGDRTLEQTWLPRVTCPACSGNGPA